MDHVVAVRVALESGEVRFFLTWGRIQDAVDGDAVAAIVLRRSADYDLGSPAVSASVCPTLQEARDQPYFFEAIISFSQRPIPFGPGYEVWRAATDDRMRSGKDLYYLGRA